MSWRNPDVELHSVGWPAVLFIVALCLWFLTTILNLATVILEKVL